MMLTQVRYLEDWSDVEVFGPQRTVNLTLNADPPLYLEM
jgi:hypothetical protein